MSPGIKLFLTIAVFTALYAGAQGEVLAVFASVLILAAVFLAYGWNRSAFNRLTVERHVDRRRAEFGQELHYELSITNDKFLPLLWLRIHDRIPEQAVFRLNKVIRKVLGSQHFMFQDVFSLGWYQRAVRRYAFVPRRRGYYEFGPAVVYQAGAFGLFENSSQEIMETVDLIVYPKILALHEMGLDYQQLFGRRPRDGWVHTDPLNVMGVRPYQTTDSLKSINWKASARHQQLESNVEKPSLDDEIHIFLEAVAPTSWWEMSEQNAIEASIMATASIADVACRKGRRVGLYSNLARKRSAGQEGTILAPGSLKDQRNRIMTALALMQGYSSGKLTATMERLKRTIPSGSRGIVVCGEPNDQMQRLLMAYHRRYRLTVIQLGPRTGEMPAIHRLFIDKEVDWHDRVVLETA